MKLDFYALLEEEPVKNIEFLGKEKEVIISIDTMAAFEELEVLKAIAVSKVQNDINDETKNVEEIMSEIINDFVNANADTIIRNHAKGKKTDINKLIKTLSKSKKAELMYSIMQAGNNSSLSNFTLK